MGKTAGGKRGRKRRPGLILFQAFIALGFLALLWSSFGQNVIGTRSAGVPKRLGASLELVSAVEGTEALAQVNKLHGTGIELAGAYIAEYAHVSPYHSGNERVMVWVGKAESSNAAAGLLERMMDGIAKEGSGFGNLKRLTIASREVFQVDGPGGKHFFYQSGERRDRVVWLTVEAGEPTPILEEAVKIF